MSLEDKELDEMFHGEEKPLHPDTIHESLTHPSVAVSKKESTTTTRPERKAQKATEKAVDASWEPEKPAPNWFDKLKDAVKWGFTFGCLSCLVFYWQSAGLMAPSVAVPTMCVCTALAGWGVGKNATRGGR